MAIDTSIAAVTVRAVDVVTVPEVALMLAEPTSTLCANPVLVIVAVETVSDDHVNIALRFCVLPSVNVPVAANCSDVPRAIAGNAGVMARDTSAAAVTVSFVDPVKEPAPAVIVAVPWATPLANPGIEALLIVATAGVSEPHCTVPVISCVLLSV